MSKEIKSEMSNERNFQLTDQVTQAFEKKLRDLNSDYDFVLAVASKLSEHNVDPNYTNSSFEEKVKSIMKLYNSCCESIELTEQDLTLFKKFDFEGITQNWKQTDFNILDEKFEDHKKLKTSYTKYLSKIGLDHKIDLEIPKALSNIVKMEDLKEKAQKHAVKSKIIDILYLTILINGYYLNNKSLDADGEELQSSDIVNLHEDQLPQEKFIKDLMNQEQEISEHEVCSTGVIKDIS